MSLKNKPNYLRYSGISVIITLNPAHWSLRPFFRNEENSEWGMPDKQWAIGWLFLTVRAWIDSGQW